MIKRKKNMFKNAEVSSTFTFLASAVIIGVILLFGGYAVTQLLSNIQKVEEVQFRQSIEQRITSVSSKYGSVEVFDLTGLRSYTKACVFDLENFVIGSPPPDSLLQYPLMLGDVEDKTFNFFLLDHNDAVERFLNTNIRVQDPFYECVNISSQGVITIRLEGLGRAALFSFVDRND